MTQGPAKISDGTTGPQTLPAFFFDSALKHGDIRALYAPHAKPIIELSYSDMAALVKKFGAGMLSLGLSGGDHVAIFADNRPRWIITDLGLLSAGMITVPRGCDTSTSEFEFI
jgi:long-chain acyl-CoA synthetase